MFLNIYIYIYIMGFNGLQGKLKLFTLARHDQDSAGQRWAVIYYITGALSPGLPPAPSPTAWVDATPIVQFAWSAELHRSSSFYGGSPSEQGVSRF